MEFSGRVFLASIEEDNIQRSLFRVRPLLDASGPISQEDLDSLEDEGFLRIVPDKQEQYTFKDRMRTLGTMCLIDLRRVPREVSKVRLNKNYAPLKGERNRYVIYSDAIQSLEEQPICEVVADPRSPVPVTSCYYLRSGGHIEGPYDKYKTTPVDALNCIAPDSDRLFAVTMPDERERLFFWPDDGPHPLEISPPEPAAQEPPPAAALLPNDPAQTLLPAVKKLNGTPLQRPNLRRIERKPGSRALEEVVDRAVRQVRPEEPGNYSTRAEILPVDPGERLDQALEVMWQSSDLQCQAADHILSMEGAAELLGCIMTNDRGNTVILAMKQQMEDLEAERLALLIQLEDLAKDKAALVQVAVAAQNKALGQAAQQEEALRQSIQTLEGQLAQLIDKRDALLKLDHFHTHSPRFIRPAQGQNCTPAKAAKLITEALTKAGFICDKDTAMNLLIHAMLYKALRVSAPYLTDARLAARTFADAIGAECAAQVGAHSHALRLAGGDAPAFLIGTDHDPCSQDFTQIIIGSLTGSQEAEEESKLGQPWPVITLVPQPGFGLTKPAQRFIIREEQMRQAILEGARELPSAAMELLEQLDEALRQCKQPLPQAFKLDVLQYLRCAQSQLDGGIAAALDFALSCWVLPFVKLHEMDISVLLPFMPGMPRSQALL